MGLPRQCYTQSRGLVEVIDEKDRAHAQAVILPIFERAHVVPEECD
jgi:hypothetical protein